MPNYSLRCDVRRTESTTDLLADLHRSEPGFAPYLLTAWSPELTAQDTVVLTYLAPLLDEPRLCGNRGPDTPRPSGSPGTARSATPPAWNSTTTTGSS